ncbi:unnamed protein product [Rotaria sp. Silwood1]|nr:unnamed protein product [Rotaria sp. Silwood1]CAF4969024.1 unnamed protein product [Rotaria sp. Silwood1]
MATTKEDSAASESVISSDNGTVVGGDNRPVTNGDDRPVVGGDDRPIVRGDNRPVVGGDKRPVVNGDDRPIVRGDSRPIVRGDNRSIVRGDNRPVVGGDDRPIILEGGIKGSVVTVNRTKHYAFIKRRDKPGDRDLFVREASIIGSIRDKRFFISDLSKIIMLQCFPAKRGVEAVNVQIIDRTVPTATIRRELDGRMKQAESLQRQRGLMPKFIHKEMDSLYVDEFKKSINDLMSNLESLPVRGGSEQKFLR